MFTERYVEVYANNIPSRSTSQTETNADDIEVEFMDPRPKHTTAKTLPNPRQDCKGAYEYEFGKSTQFPLST